MRMWDGRRNRVSHCPAGPVARVTVCGRPIPGTWCWAASLAGSSRKHEADQGLSSQNHNAGS